MYSISNSITFNSTIKTIFSLFLYKYFFAFENFKQEIQIASNSHLNFIRNLTFLSRKFKALLTLVITTTIGIPRFCDRVSSPRGSSTLSSSVVLAVGWRGFTSRLWEGTWLPELFSSGSVYSWKNLTTRKSSHWDTENYGVNILFTFALPNCLGQTCAF